MVEDYKRKLEQGSQQLQGEVLELELENIIRREFPYDEIKEVPKGVNGPDLIQVVKNDRGKVCGTIVWESKRKQFLDPIFGVINKDDMLCCAEIEDIWKIVF